MDILGIGLPEIFFIVLLALILLGPKDMVKAGRTIGRALRAFVTSPTWQVMRNTGREIQQLPVKLMREAGLEELQAEVQQVKGNVETAARQSLEEVETARRQILAAPFPSKPAAPVQGQTLPPSSPPTSES
ncbi:MAG: twin-arginine translocase TatA/TatE family subunit [Anaerolineales bacterium]|nr:twin-arginine translocase TatA/TatE family subunit [Anaerolineales bacterium]MCX7755882.1 twin-arginine translocase TatA/TatE family subunit [Anaerolineales bacterium]MDW8277954.1 twin-arginine translocase TatA/TatE family subunit [Anaerolineales bacterium]